MTTKEPRSYYNEIDRFAAQWLRNLIEAGLIPAGDVDERDINEVTPNDLKDYTQCHFFAGIAGWPLALQLAGWPACRPVWTGSCPCQPFSAAGKQKGEADERHLWPVFARLIEARKPSTVFGEQVASKLGRNWLAGVRTQMEALGYGFGGADLSAASVGAPHIRQRLFWVGHADRNKQAAHPGDFTEMRRIPGEEREGGGTPLPGGAGSPGGGLADAKGDKWEQGNQNSGRHGEGDQKEGGSNADSSSPFIGVANSDRGQRAKRDNPLQDGSTKRGRGDCQYGGGRVGDTNYKGSQEHGRPDQLHYGQREREDSHRHARHPVVLGWDDYEPILCIEPTKEPGRFIKKVRRIKSGLFPLAHGVPGRVGRLRAYGNAIVPQVAAVFIRSFMEATEGGAR